MTKGFQEVTQGLEMSKSQKKCFYSIYTFPKRNKLLWHGGTTSNWNSVVESLMGLEQAEFSGLFRT